MGASVAEDPVTNDLTNDLGVGSSRRCETFRKRTLLLLVFLCILISFSLGVTTVVVSPRGSVRPDDAAAFENPRFN